MSIVTATSWQHDFGVNRTGYPGFFSNKDDLSITVPQTHVLRQAFDQLELDGILCYENTPLIYFKQVAEIHQNEALQLHRKFWNHGGAPILVLIAQDKVHIYSGMVRPKPIENASATPACLIEALNRVPTGLQHFLISVESGAYFQEHAHSFDSNNRVDHDLLVNLRDTREMLHDRAQKGFPLDLLDTVLCRLVFTCYLFDRDVIGRKYLSDLEITDCKHLRDVLNIRPLRTARSTLYKLFRKLGEDFNGDLFSDYINDEERHINDKHIQTLCDFFHGTQVRTGQGNFWPYDFGYIPIETISAIYEHFLKSEDLKNGAFYTPRFLAEVVLDTALEGIEPLIGKTYFDPACGSGIFLVGLFNRIATEWMRVNPNARNDRKAKELMALLRKSLFGIDENPTACRIAAFSLYLAYLDQLSPRDIQELQRKGQALPCLVANPADHSTKDTSAPLSNIQCADFFSESPGFSHTVDLIIGNPPWGSLASDTTLAGQWCSKNQKPIPDKQVSAAFVWKATDHVNAKGSICFVLPHGTLFNHSSTAIKFQKAWAGLHRIDRVLNLTDLRFFMFREANHPAIVVRYRKEAPDVHSDSIEYWTPKVDWPAIQAEIITVTPADRTNIEVRELLNDLDTRDAPQVWNRYFWGSPRDLRLLDKLCAFPRLRDHVRASSEKNTSKRWVRAEGFQPLGINDQLEKAKRVELPSRDFITAKSSDIDLLLQPDDCEKLASQSVLVRQKSNTNTEIFRAPHVLITKGFRRIAFANFDVSFQSAVRGIHGPVEDRKLLMFLAAYLRTDLARYFTFHTSSNWGVYRPEVHVEEFLRLPLPLPDQLDDSQRGQQIVDEVARILDVISMQSTSNFLRRRNAIQSASVEIEPLIDEYFDIQPLERLLIADTINVIVPSVQPTLNRMPVPTLRTCTREQCTVYTEQVCSILNKWARSSEYIVRGNSKVSSTLGVGVVMLEKCRQSSVSETTPQIENDLLQVLQKIRNTIPTHQGAINPIRSVMLFDENRLYILKSAAQFHWTKTAALNDADTLAATLLTHTPRETA